MTDRDGHRFRIMFVASYEGNDEFTDSIRDALLSHGGFSSLPVEEKLNVLRDAIDKAEQKALQ